MVSGKCWACGVVANMTVVPGSGVQRPVTESEDDFSTTLIACFRCDGCGTPAIGLMSSDGWLRIPGDTAIWMANESSASELSWLPFDTRGRDFPDVPSHIASAASEAHVCLSAGVHRGAVMLARAVVEASAKEKGIIKGDLKTMIDQMYERGLIREYVRDGAHEVRYLGNEMAHGDFVEPVAKQDADLVLTLMNEVLDEVFQSPARVERRREARTARSRDAGTQR
jgi:Domain of unknown function (DUF4145)